MSYDLNILVLQGEKPVKLPFNSSIGLINETEQSLRYYDSWSYMTHTNGIWYCLGHGEDELFSALSILKAHFGSNREQVVVPNWISDENVLSNLVPFSVITEYVEDLVRIIKHLINLSPIKTIMFLARFQSYDEEIVYGVLTFEQFWLLHQKNELLFNVCYIIRE